MAMGLAPDWPKMSIAQANALLSGEGSPLVLTETEIDGVLFKTYAEAPPTLRHLFELARAGFGPRVFFVYQDERVTVDAQARAVAHMARVLTETYGIKKGDRISIIMRNYPQWPVAFWAALMIGAIVTPMNSWWTGEELEYGINDSSARLAIVDPQIFERLRDHWPDMPDLEAMIVARDADERPDPRVTAMEEYIGPATGWADLEDIPLPAVEIAPDDDASIMYTSGTTGKPKGALASHRAIISNMFNALTCRARRYLRAGEPIPEPDPDPANANAVLLSVPLFHATGAFAVLVPSLATGGKIVTMYKWDAGEALGIIERERINAIGGVPAIAWQVLEHPDREKYDLSSINSVAYGGAPSAPELVSTIKSTLKEAQPSNGWGMTETCATATQNFGEDYVNRPTSAGAPPPAVELKIVGPDGETLPAGEVGELWCKGPSNCKLYWNRPEATATTFIDGWVVTGDLAKLDEEGFVYLVDRAKDMLIRGGENIYCIEVENALYDHPAIMDASVVGIPHKVLGEEVGAVVQVKPGKTTTVDDLRAHVASQLAAFKVPVEIVIQSDPLPRNANGKILKPVLRER
ncbi:MAG: class I adenylate-forming enzyme family protein, partial [Pseudomonadota bacterium]